MGLTNVKICCCSLQYLGGPDDDLFRSKHAVIIGIYPAIKLMLCTTKKEVGDWGGSGHGIFQGIIQAFAWGN
jgi:hypothetical protein